MTPQISIIIPLHNAEPYLEACLDSVLRQTFQDFEILLIDDGSTDHSPEIARAYAMRNPEKIRLFRQENCGQAVARNRGIDQAAGEFVAFVDSDDTIRETMLEQMYQEAVRQDADVTVCDIRVIRPAGSQAGPEIEPGLNPLAPGDDWRKSYLISAPSPCNKLIRVRLLREHQLRFLERSIYEDLAMIPQAALFANRIAYIGQPLYQYILRSVSTMNNNRNVNRLDDIFSVMATLRQAFADADADGRYHFELEYLFIEHLLFGASHRFLTLPGYRGRSRKIRDIMQASFPQWRFNPYYRSRDWKYRLACSLFYHRFAWPLRIRKALNGRRP